jgi:hypothetical protein
MMTDMKEPIRIHINPELLIKEDIDRMLMSKYDVFYRRLVEYVLNKIEGQPESDLIAILVDEEGVEYEMNLPEQGYSKSLTKAMEYFLLIEEYETCDLIKQIKKNL